MMTIEGHQTGSTVPMHMDMPEKVKKVVMATEQRDDTRKKQLKIHPNGKQYQLTKQETHTQPQTNK